MPREAAKKDYHRFLREVERHKAEILRAKIRIKDLEKESFQLESNYKKSKSIFFNDMLVAFNKLRDAISKWEEDFIITTPSSGRASFFLKWSENQYIETGDELLTIVPNGENTLVGEVSLSMKNSGKVKVGQRALVRLDIYPYREYGMVHGVIESISLVPKGDLYSIKLVFPDGLKTTFERDLEFRQKMKGEVDLITDDRRLIQRIFMPLRNIQV